MPMPQLVPILIDDGDGTGSSAVAETAEPESDRTLDLTLLPTGESGEESPLFGKVGGAWDRLSAEAQVKLYLDAFALSFNHGRRWIDP